MNTNKNGIVYLVGAGPGDPELVTRKALRLLQLCDVVVYDNLIPDELIVSLPENIEKHYVGKRGGKTCTSQDEINALLVSLAEQGKTIVRLKGSDPLIFGRGGEEAKYLKQHDISFEIVPGITSGIAAPAYAGIPCTDRELASSVLFVTGHKAKEKQTSSVDWSWVAKARNTTVVIYMGVSEIGNIVALLVNEGMSKDIPAALIERGTFPTQRTFVTTISELSGTVHQHNVTGPAVFIIGEVVKLREKLDWFKNKPLLGIKVMVTRPADQAQWMYHRLLELGAETLPYPTIATKEYVDTKSWQAFEKISTPDRWLVFTSENGVRYFFRQLFDNGYDIRTLGSFKIVVIGAGTVRALETFGLKSDFVPTSATTAALAKQFVTNESLQNTTVVRVRGNLSTDNIDEAVVSAGADLIPMTVYETFFTKWPEHLKEKLLNNPPDVVTFTSGTTVEGLFENLNEKEIDEIIKPATLVSIGPSTSEVLRSHGLEPSLEAGKHTIPDLIDELVSYAQTHFLRRES